MLVFCPMHGRPRLRLNVCVRPAYGNVKRQAGLIVTIGFEGNRRLLAPKDCNSLATPEQMGLMRPRRMLPTQPLRLARPRPASRTGPSGGGLRTKCDSNPTIQDYPTEACLGQPKRLVEATRLVLLFPLHGPHKRGSLLLPIDRGDRPPRFDSAGQRVSRASREVVV